MFKKIMAIALVIAIAVSVGVLGTIAYLTKQTNAVVNTFVASKGLIDNPTSDPTKNGIFILETDEKDKTKTTTTGNEYVAVPGVDIKKDAHIHLKGKTDLRAYLFLEVKDTLDKELSYTIITDNWLDTGLTGKNGGKIYVYKEIVNKDLDISILKNDTITVSADYDAKDGGALSFYSYLCQEASFETDAPENYVKNAKLAFNACFAS